MRTWRASGLRRVLSLFTGLVSFLISESNLFAGNERFDFAASSSTLGFGQGHHVELTVEPGGPLVARATGRDPFFLSPNVSLRAAKQGMLIVHAAFEGNVRQLGVYFITDKSPQWGSDKHFNIRVQSDARPREIHIPVGAHPLWQGTVTRYRLDLEPADATSAVLRLFSVEYRYPTEPVLARLSTSKSVLTEGTTATISVEIENPAPDPATDVEVRFQVSNPAVRVSPAQVSSTRIAADERMTVSAVIRGLRTGTAVLEAVLLRKGVELDRRPAALCIASGETGTTDIAAQGIYRLSNGLLQAAAVADGQALTIHLGAESGLAEWWAHDGNRYVRVGRAFPLVSLLHGERTRRLDVVRWRETPPVEIGPAKPVALTGDLGPPGSEAATVAARIQPVGHPAVWLQVDITLEALQAIHLRAFVSPRLLAGDGTFGAERDEGLFPGLEYLEKGEHSSSQLDYHTAEHLRTVPHPKKITLPLMALTCGDRLFMLRWDRPQPDGDGLRAPAAGFASPNFVDGQANHLLALFEPGVGVSGGIAENHWEAEKPVLIRAGEQLALRYWLGIHRKPDVHVADAYDVIRKTAEKNLFEYARPPRDIAAERALCRMAYTDVAWNEKERGWHHALPATGGQWPAFPETFALQFLESELAEKEGEEARDRSVAPTEAERKRTADVFAKGLAHRTERSGGHASAEDFYFAGETLLECIEAHRAQAHAAIKRQRDDGSWGFDPGGDARRAELGPAGKAEIGICADCVIPVLEYALMTGDAACEAAAIKALEHMKCYAIPRAAQVWEIPVHTPDIMGAARGATAYRLGWLLTGREDYRKRARYWLSTGLPFLYFWGHPKWPYWLNATIPVFGATHYRAPNWVGLPVQWCGLVWAEEALRCAPWLGEPWAEAAAAGIVHSAMWQQPTEGEYRGLLPDSYPFASVRGQGPWIATRTILQPLWLMRGYDFHVNTMLVLRGNDRSLRLSALARVTTVGVTADQTLRAQLNAVCGVPVGVLICGLPAEPAEVLWQGKALPRRDKLSRADNGWAWVADRRWLLANVRGTGKPAEFLVRPVEK
ncbi:MAG: hypothetical protein N3D11_11415 [Candidatus Sumerlaeia bacterium]|nr:hypothetical protein [Candidatus Sumerlaeia bacterium]